MPSLVETPTVPRVPNLYYEQERGPELDWQTWEAPSKPPPPALPGTHYAVSPALNVMVSPALRDRPLSAPYPDQNPSWVPPVVQYAKLQADVRHRLLAPVGGGEMMSLPRVAEVDQLCQREETGTQTELLQHGPGPCRKSGILYMKVMRNGAPPSTQKPVLPLCLCLAWTESWPRSRS